MFITRLPCECVRGREIFCNFVIFIILLSCCLAFSQQFFFEFSFYLALSVYFFAFCEFCLFSCCIITVLFFVCLRVQCVVVLKFVCEFLLKVFMLCRLLQTEVSNCNAADFLPLACFSGTNISLYFHAAYRSLNLLFTTVIFL